MLDDGQVRVSVGDGQTSATSSGLGFGTTDLSVSFGRDSSMEHARLATMTIDTSTAAGRDAYNGFVLLGQVPDTGASFVNEVAQVTTFAYDTAAGFHAEASLLSVDASVDAANRLMHGSETYVSHPDGSWEQDYVQQYSDKASLTYRESSVPGVPNSEGTYTYTFHNLDPVQAGQLSSLYGRPIPAGSTVDVSFSESTMQQYRETRRAVGGSYGPQYKLDGDRGQFASAILQSQQGDPATVVEWLAHADTDVLEGNRQPIGVGEVKIRT
ncbi:hypothetical protein [Propioniciclava sp.]|uniref:hypothetical protein n=1 Tax=Propioniciclava sp. TaxID=2038686 RepID=UPI00262725F6|nr:hypothetical protein [Propioniciclava sp.]